MINAEAEIANSLMQYEHHAESSHRGSVTGRSFVQRDREKCHDRMMKDYFIERPRFLALDFRRRFRMRRELFENILNAFVNHDHYFARKIDHEWKNCPTGWAGRFKSHHNKPTIVLKVVASYDTCIWHAFFGAPRSNNDINVLWSSHLFENIVNGWASEFRYKGAIMAVGASKPTVVADADGFFSVKSKMLVNVTADHRIVYGADLAAFPETFAKIVENPESLTL
ncbi:uncharacterized protein [Pyrus communis]|uniref:uncharacterized protein n=1 Tax=Pyrus communis TaxID=23211 RepID=UPI0035C08E7A